MPRLSKGAATADSPEALEADLAAAEAAEAEALRASNPAANESEAQPKDSSTAKPRRGRPPGSTNKTSAKADSLEEIRQDLTLLLTGIGSVTVMALPVTGLTIVGRAERAASNIVMLAERNPKVLRQLKRLLAVSKGAELAQIVAAVGIGVGVDSGSIPPESPLIDHVAGIRAEVTQVQELMAAQAAAQTAGPNGAAS